MVEINRNELLKNKGIIDVSKICKLPEGTNVKNEDLDKILAELLTCKYEGGDNANS